MLRRPKSGGAADRGHLEMTKEYNIRLWVLYGILLLCLALFVGILYEAQAVNGADYYEQSASRIPTSETVEASRGVITDRNGKVLVSNRQVYTITFDSSELPEGANPNEAILRLIHLCEDYGITWEDNLPISAESPYSYTTDATTDSLRSRFGSFLTSCGWIDGELTEESPYPVLNAATMEKEGLSDGNVSAYRLLEMMRDYFAIDPDLSMAEARKIIGVRYELAVRTLVNTTAYVFASDVPVELISILTDGNYAGVVVGTSSIRQYNTDRAAHILGYIGAIGPDEYDALIAEGYSGDDLVGKDGVEQAFESYLRGTDGKRVITTDENGKITGELYTKQPIPGGTVTLSIDIDLQAAVEDALAAAVTAMNEEDGLTTRGGAAVVVGVGTGEVLAMASYPTYDLASFSSNYNEYAADPANPLWNRSTNGLYAPGSTLKPLTAIAALEEGVTTISERLYDTGRWIYPGTGMGPACWRRSGHGWVNVTSAVANSCNYYFAEMGYRLGMDTLREYLSAFGLGESSGIEIGDAAGRLPENPPGEDQAPWAAFGQSNQLYTPLQLANYIATLAAGGDYYQPHLLKTVRSYDNSEILYSATNTAPTRTINLDPENLSAVLEGMLDYTQPGGQIYTYFRDCVVTAGAKTGTAQLGGDSENNGVFVCFAPYEDPEIAVSVVIEKGGSGAALASTAVEILNAYFSDSEIGAAIIPEDTLLP